MLGYKDDVKTLNGHVLNFGDMNLNEQDQDNIDDDRSCQRSIAQAGVDQETARTLKS